MFTPRYFPSGWLIACSLTISLAFEAGARSSEQVPIKTPTFTHRARPVACRGLYEPDGKHQCGLIEVPLDYHNPSAGNGQIYYARLPADEGVRRGTIFVDPGLPFATTPDMSVHAWMLVRGKAMHDRTGGEYDVIVWDARGKGTPSESLTIPGPVQCFANTTERDEFYASTAAGLGIDVSWDHTLRQEHMQDDHDISRWYAVQEQVVEYCLATTDTATLSYMGTAATARDLAAMADMFDGPGSPINFFGIGHGSLIGSYLLKLFPERVGRLILDDPVDPKVYAGEDPYLTWRKDVQWANTTLARYAKECMEDHDIGCRLTHYQPEESIGKFTVAFVGMTIALARSAFMGWKPSLGLEFDNVEYRSFLEDVHRVNIPGARGPSRAWFVHLNNVTRSLDESLGIGLMPVFCGDLDLEHDSETMRARARQMPDALTSSMADAPILLQAAFPSLQYMCHLWPIRAVERYSDLLTPERTRPANPVLVLSSELNLLSRPEHAHSVLRALRGPNEEYREDADIVLQAQFGVPNLAHGRCMSDVISNYLRNGTMPARHRCYANGVKDNWIVPPQEIKATPLSPLQRAQSYPPIRGCISTSEPFPTGWVTSDGRPVLFYVKAIHPYTAAEPGDLEVQVGDIVAVTEMRDDGWLYGEPVDEARRQPGKYLLPGNFVCLF